VENRERIFSDYAYFSSYSDTWLAHARDFAREVAAKLQLGRDKLVVELASNDGYLLKEFQALGIRVLGVEPAGNVARVAESAGVPTIVDFFGSALGRRLASQGKTADLIVANNVLAHVPDVNDFVSGIALQLKEAGTATIEFPHLLRTLQRGEFDTIYHEHFSYFSLRTAQRIFERHGLRVSDVEELPTHGGSLRVWVRHAKSATPSESVDRVLAEEGRANLERLDAYSAFQGAAVNAKRALVTFLQEARRAGKRVVGYGAPAKATTLLNYCEIGVDLLEYTVDRSPHKQGRLIPGVRVPIEAPEKIFKSNPDFVLLLPWNLKDEIVRQMSAVREWGAKFVVAVPALEIVA
jgi:SAM-dependent methyltransferase